MSNTSVKEINDMKYNEKEFKSNDSQQKNDCYSQKEDSNMLSESKTKVNANSVVNELMLDVINLNPLSTASNVTVIDMQDNLPQNNSNMLGELSKQGKQSRTYSFQQKRPAVWIQFSYGKGSGMGQGREGDLAYEPESRNSFVLLVMIILFVMLMITAGWTMLVYNIEPLYKIFHRPSPILFFGVAISLVVVMCSIGCFNCLVRPPCIYFMATLVLVLMSLFAGMITCRYRTVIVIYAFIASSAVVLICTILACTSFDFTSYWLYFVVIFGVFSVLSLLISVSMFAAGIKIPMLHLVILVISTLLHSVGLIMELQMILGGKSIELDETEYVLGALMMYTSIMTIFLNLVKIFGILDSW